MKRLSVPARIIVIVYLAVLFFMLIAPLPRVLLNPRNPLAKPTKDYYQPVFLTDYGTLFVNIFILSVVAALALIASPWLVVIVQSWRQRMRK